MKPPHTANIDELTQHFATNLTTGLTTKEAQKRLKKYGPNALKQFKVQHPILIFFSQFKNSLVALLLVASIISFLFRDYTEAGAILLVILINAVIGFVLELQANRSMQSLRKLDIKMANVLRDGKMLSLDATQLVPGDIIFLESGDLANADGRIVESSQLEVNESLLTGESVPVEKNNEDLPENAILADQKNMFFKGTSATRGNARVLVTSTGMQTQIGQISSMMEKAQIEEIPLNKKLNKLSRKLIWLTIFIILLFVAVGYYTGRDLYLMIETAIALAVAAIPEGLPIVATIALATGMLKMAKNKVLVKKLSAVESLGETDLIMTDKTGTITENKLKAHQLSFPNTSIEITTDSTQNLATLHESDNLYKLIQIAVLCNNASIDGDGEGIGDPLETALLHFAWHENEKIYKATKKWKRVYEKAFDSDSRIMITGHQHQKTIFMSLKGSPTEVLACCDTILSDKKIEKLNKKGKDEWINTVNKMAAEGLKVLGFGFKELDHLDKSSDNFHFIGLVGFLDPPRGEISDAIKQCNDAGIKVVMVTGDHLETAKAISRQIGLGADEENQSLHGSKLENLNLDQNAKILNDVIIFSRVNPAQKLDLVNYYQQQGNVVAMTGDGVNDAPALKKADVGIAMGVRGTEVAREAADMVLQNDSFAAIVNAIRQGRIIFNNIRNFVIYLLSCNLSEIFIVGFAAFSNLALPLLPLQILFLNLVTDVFPALALGMGGGNDNIMRGKFQKSNEPILNKDNWKSIIVYALILTLSVLSAYIFTVYNLVVVEMSANNIAFYALAFAQLTHPLNLIPKSDHFFKNEIVQNLHLWLAILFCALLMVGIHWIEPVRLALNLDPFHVDGILIIAIASILPVLIIRILKEIGWIK